MDGRVSRKAWMLWACRRCFIAVPMAFVRWSGVRTCEPYRILSWERARREQVYARDERVNASSWCRPVTFDLGGPRPVRVAEIVVRHSTWSGLRISTLISEVLMSRWPDAVLSARRYGR